MDDRNKQRVTKLIKVFTKLIPLFMVCFFMAMLPLPHTLRLIGFIGSLVFFISVFFMDAFILKYKRLGVIIAVLANVTCLSNGAVARSGEPEEKPV